MVVLLAIRIHQSNNVKIVISSESIIRLIRDRPSSLLLYFVVLIKIRSNIFLDGRSIARRKFAKAGKVSEIIFCFKISPLFSLLSLKTNFL